LVRRHLRTCLVTVFPVGDAHGRFQPERANR
jgi:hypothetical protein